MLILSRKLGEKIVVPQCGLSVAVIGIQGNRVRLGISAPPTVAVHREEVFSAIQLEGVTDTRLEQETCDAPAADLSDAAYQIALCHRPADSWMELEMDVSRRSPRPSSNGSKNSRPRCRGPRMFPARRLCALRSVDINSATMASRLNSK